MPSCTKVRAASSAAPHPCPVSQPDSKGAAGRAHKALGEEKVVYELYEHVLKLQALGLGRGLASQPCCSPSCIPELFACRLGCGSPRGGCWARDRQILQSQRLLSAPGRVCKEWERRGVNVGNVGSIPPPSLRTRPALSHVLFGSRSVLSEPPASRAGADGSPWRRGCAEP